MLHDLSWLESPGTPRQSEEIFYRAVQSHQWQKKKQGKPQWCCSSHFLVFDECGIGQATQLGPFWGSAYPQATQGPLKCHQVSLVHRTLSHMWTHTQHQCLFCIRMCPWHLCGPLNFIALGCLIALRKVKHDLLLLEEFGVGCGEWEGGMVLSGSGTKNASSTGSKTKSLETS